MGALAKTFDNNQTSPTLTDMRSRRGPQGAGMRVVVVSGPDRGRLLELTKGRHTIGKRRGCALTLTDPAVSREHLALEVSDTQVHLHDLASKNGTFLGGVRIRECELSLGAVFRVGSTVLKLCAGEASEEEFSTLTRFGGLLGRSPRMREVFETLRRVAATEATVLIEAETGCGKELCAEAIHLHSQRAGGPFVICDFAGISPSVMESELFGHVKGSFTGAVADRRGAFLDADGGTIFLDEIGELALDMQPRLLRALEKQEVRPIGADRYQRFSARIVAATNRDLEHEVKRRRFREDLFHRLSVLRVRLPPLREHKEDLPLLIEHLVGRPDIEIPPETLSVLVEYDWPGNVRELKNVLERAVSRMRPGDTTLSPSLLGLSTPGLAAEIPWQKLYASDFTQSRDLLVSTWERNYLRQLLARTEGNISRAARESGIDRAYLHRLLRKHGLTGVRSGGRDKGDR